MFPFFDQSNDGLHMQLNELCDSTVTQIFAEPDLECPFKKG